MSFRCVRHIGALVVALVGFFFCQAEALAALTTPEQAQAVVKGWLAQSNRPFGEPITDAPGSV